MGINLIIYNIITYLLFPMFLLMTLLKNYFKKRIYPIKMILEKINLKVPKADYIWLQAASAGEVLLANTLINELATVRSDIKWLIYTTTYSGFTMAKNKLDEKAEIIYLPWDIGFVIRKLVNLFPPKLLIIIESDFWPNLIYQMKKSKVSIIMVNGKVSERIWKRYQRMRFFLRDVIKKVDLFLMQAQPDVDRLIELGVDEPKIKISGNLKLDQQFPKIPEDERKILKESLKLNNKRIIIAGSTHEGEEQIIIDSFLNVYHKHPDLKLIIAPRHLERHGQIENLLKQRHISYQLRSKISDEFAADYQIIILDTMGELSKLYSLAYFSFVGGSLVNIGGHNFLEPIAQGSPVFYGPYTQNFQEIEQLIANYKVGFKVNDGNDLTVKWQNLLINEQLYQFTKNKTDELINANRGLITQTLKVITDLL